MSITITAADIADQYPQFDSVTIESYFDVVMDKISVCVEAAYPTDAIANKIITLGTLYFASLEEGGEVTQERAANGASTTYSQDGSGDGLKSNRYGRALLALDTHGCSAGLVPETIMFDVIGSTDKSKYYR